MVDEALNTVKQGVSYLKKIKSLIAVRNSTGMFTISYNIGGRIPDSLEGFYTSTTYAEDAIKSYYVSKDAILKDKRPYHKNRKPKLDGTSKN